MTFEIALVFAIVAAALYLFASEKLPLDITALLILTTVMAIPLLFHSRWLLERGIDLESAFPTVREGLSGFSSPATITVLCMFVLSSGIQRSGLLHLVGQRLFPFLEGSEPRRLLLMGALVGPVSAFINNTAAVAMAIPMLLDLARRSGTPAARLLLPLSFFGMLGGTLTLIGTSTNILASSILADTAEFGRPLGMFEFSSLGLIVLGSGLVYLATVGRWLMPTRDATELGDEARELFLVELRVRPDSPLIDDSLEEAGFASRTGVEVVKLVRGGRAVVKKASTTVLRPGDVILVRATPRQVFDLIGSAEIEVLSELGEARPLRKDGHLVPVLLRNRRRFAGRSGAEVDFWRLYRARPVGLDAPTAARRRLADEPLHVGEVVLLSVSSTALERLRTHPDLIVLHEYENDHDPRTMALAGGIVAAVVLLATLSPLPIVVTAVAGVVAMGISGCLDRNDLYSGVAWDVILLLAGVIPLGVAMTKSGAADWLAGLIAAQATHWHPVLMLMALYAVTTLLTELVSNNASVVILVPVALSIAASLGLAPLPLVLTVMFAASTSFLSPVGYQTNTMIYGTGVYRFTDFARVGAPLNALLMVVTSLAIYWLWPLRGAM